MKPNASLNVKFDPQTTKLTWDCRENASSGECVLIHKEKGLIKKKVKDSECQCTFQDYSLHGGVTLTVEVHVNQRRLSEMLVYTNPGREHTGGDPSAPHERLDTQELCRCEDFLALFCHLGAFVLGRSFAASGIGLP